MPSNICFPNISKAQSLQRRATSKDWRLQDPLSSNDFSQVLLSQLWTVVLRDLDAALISKYVRDGKGRGNIFRQDVEAEYTNKFPSNIPIIITKSNMYITFMELFSKLAFQTQRRS